jgi:VanZ family protein
MAACIALVAWLGVVFAITLSPHNIGTQKTGNRAVASAKREIDLPVKIPKRVKQRETDLIGNVLLFVPVGFLGVLALPGRRRTVAIAGPLLSGAIETFQMGYLPHRNASLGDVFTNSTGHYAGMVAAIVVIAALTRALGPPRSDDHAPTTPSHPDLR